MGLTISGDTADMAFYTSVEKAFIIEEADPRIRLYARFKDDVFMIFRGSHDAVHAWFEEFKQASSIFLLELEQVSSSGVSYLDLQIGKYSRWQHTGHPDIWPYQKPSSRAAPLVSNSYHPRSQHKSWPLCRFWHYGCVSTSRSSARSACMALYNRIRSHDCSHPSLSSLDILLKSKSTHAVRGKVSEPVSGTWIIIPYHPCWIPLQKVVAKFRRAWEHESSIAQELQYLDLLLPRISWSRGGQPLSIRLGRRDEELVMVQNS